MFRYVRSNIAQALTFLSVGALLWSTSVVQASGSGITYQGRILKPDGNALESTNVQFRLQIRTPNSSNCLMYEEIRALDMRNSRGLFSVTMNDGNGTRTDSSGYGLDRIFANRGTFALNSLTCSSGSTYTPNEDDGRKLAIQFKDDTMADWEPMPPMDLNFVPMSIESKQVQGFSARSLVRVQEADGTMGNISPLSNANYLDLLNLIAGTSPNYVRASNGAGARVPVVTGNPLSPVAGSVWFDSVSGKLKFHDGSSAVDVGGGSGGGVTSVTAGSGLVTSPGAGITATGSIAIAVGGVVTNMLADGSVTTIKIGDSQVTDVKLAANAVIEAKIANGAVTSAKILDGTIAGVDLAPDIVISTTGSVTASGFTTTGNVTVGGNVTVTGDVRASSVDSGLSTTRQLQLFDPDTSSVNKITFTADAALNADYTLKWPLTAGSANQVLSTDGLGNLSWRTLATSTGDFHADGSVPMSGVFRATGGNAALPSITFTGDTDTGIHSAGADSLGISTGGEQRLVVSNTATSIWGNLSVNGDENASYTTSSTAANSPHGAYISIRNEDDHTSRAALTKFWTLNDVGTLQGAYVGAVSEATGNTPSFVIGQQTGPNSYSERLRITPEGNVAIGTSAPEAKLGVFEKIVDPAANKTVLESFADVGNTVDGTQTITGGRFISAANIPSRASGSLVGSYSEAYNAAEGVTTDVIAAENVATHYWSGTTTNVVGTKASALGLGVGGATNLVGIESYANHVTGSITNVYGGRFLAEQSSVTALAPSVYGIRAEAKSVAGGTITNGYGVYAVVNPGGGTITNRYGVYVTDSGNGPNFYNFYSAGANTKNYFQGNVGIGTTTPARLLQVNGPVRLTPTALPSSPAAGDLAFDSANGNALKWYNGSTWQTVGSSSSSTPASGGSTQTITQAATDAASAARASLILQNNGTGGANEFNLLAKNAAGTTTFSVAQDGSVLSSGGMAIAGNVGIGTTAPTSLLHIYGSTNGTVGPTIENAANGTVAYSGVVMKSTGSQSASVVVAAPGVTTTGAGMANSLMIRSPFSNGVNIAASDALGRIRLYTGGDQAANERMRIDANGYVGINTTTPTAHLDVNGSMNIAANQNLLMGGGGAMQFNGTNLLINPTNTTRSVHVLPGAGIGVPSVAVQSPSGHVGIGTAAPQMKLDVHGSAIFRGPTVGGIDGELYYDTAAHTYNYYDAGASTWKPLGSGSISYSGTLWNQSGANLNYTTGSVSIGTTSSAATLDVNNTGGSNILSLSNGGTQRLYVDVNGNFVQLNGNTNVQILRSTNGTSGFPSISFQSSQGTGLYRPLVDTIGFSTGGSEKMRLSAAGFLGVATTTPQLPLDVNGAIRVGTSAALCSTTTEGGIRFNTVADVLEYCTGSAWVALSGTSGSTQTFASQVQFTAAGPAPAAIASGGGFETNSLNVTGVSTLGGNVNVSAGKFFVNAASGNVGIGTATPTSQLQVLGGAVTETVVGADSTGLVTAATSINSVVGQNVRLNGDTTMYPRVSGPTAAVEFGGGMFTIFTNSVGLPQRRVTVLSNGHIGIGTIAPNYKLDVAGDLRITGTPYRDGGDVAWSVSSDARLKDVTGKYERGLREIASIETILYHYSKKNPKGLASDREYTGVIAQQVQQHIPEAVQTDKDGFLTLNATPIFWAMVNAIKELARDVFGLNAEVEALKKENAEIKAYLCAKDPAAPICR